MAKKASKKQAAKKSSRPSKAGDSSKAGNSSGPKVSGPRKVADVPRETIDAIHRGERSTRNLVEALAIDAFVVAENFLAGFGRKELFYGFKNVKADVEKWTLPRAVMVLGVGFEYLREKGEVDESIVAALLTHPSDVVRSFGCFAIAAQDGPPLRAKLKRLQPLADDEHFGVREFAWMALRPCIAGDLEPAIEELAKWSRKRDANLRRFASEATRPRGVWCSHIDELKRNPEIALPILEPLKADPSEYVRLSVGNWLNDASKTRPDFVRDLCERWRRESQVAETEAICKRALRTLAKS